MNIKTSFKRFFQNFALRSGLIVNRIPPNEHLEKFLDRFKEKYKSIDMVRIGGDDDGGYLIPHPLDQSNIQNISEIVMPEIWWKK